MDRQRARTCPGGSDPGGTGPASGRSFPFPVALSDRRAGRGTRRAKAAHPVVVAVLSVLAVAGPVLAGGVGSPASAGTSTSASANVLAASAPSLVLLSQTPWVTPGQAFDLHLKATSTVSASTLGVSVSVYSCLSSLSGFDQSLRSVLNGAPVSSTTSPLPVSGLPPLAGGGFDLSMPVVIGGSATSAPLPSAPFTIHLLPAGGQCQSFPAGVFPVRIQLIDTSTSSVVGAFITHLVFSEATPDTQRLRAALVLPVQLTQVAARAPSPADLVIRPSAALATPSERAVSAVVATVASIAVQHPSVHVTLPVSGQTAELLANTGHQSTLTQLAQLAETPEVHQLTTAPFTPVDAAVMVGSGLGSELTRQVARGTEVIGGVTGRAPPEPSAGLGPWITTDGMDVSTVGALASGGFRQLVVPASALTVLPSIGSTAQPFVLSGPRNAQLTAIASSDDLSARFTGTPGNPVLAAHQLVAELSQIYYERPNGSTPRAVVATAPSSWSDDPAFVDALLGSLNANPLVQAVTTAEVFALFPVPATCRNGCRLAAANGVGGLPTAAIKSQRLRVDGLASAVTGAHTLTQQLGDVVLSAESQGLRSAQQSSVVANAASAIDAQLRQFAVEGNQTITLTAKSGLVPVTLASTAPYPVTGSLVVSSDKLLFPNGETSWSQPVTLLPRHSNVIYVRVRTRVSGVFRLQVSVRSPDDSLRLVTGSLAVRSTSSSVVGVVLTAGAVVVLAVWWFRTSLKRRRRQRATEEPSTP